MPKRIQLSRQRGYKMPPNSRSCTRSSRWGNPYKVGERGLTLDGERIVVRNREQAVRLFRRWAEGVLRTDPAWLDPLRECEHLGCFCPLDQACHVDVLIELLHDNSGRER